MRAALQRALAHTNARTVRILRRKLTPTRVADPCARARLGVNSSTAPSTLSKSRQTSLVATRCFSTPAQTPNDSSKPGELKPANFLSSLKQPIADKGYNRWLQLPPTLAVHMSIGSIYGWAMFNTPLMNSLGVVTQAANDWTLGQVVPIFSTLLICHGASALMLGGWQNKVGVREPTVYGALTFGGGLALGGVGAALHNLPLMYFGYGVLGGTGVSFAYVPAMVNLTKWFPERRGFATGTTVCGFGGGALVSAPLTERLLEWGRRAPEYLGKVSDVATTVDDSGRMFARVGGQLREVVSATANDVATWPGLSEGIYAVGTGSTGAATAFMGLGGLYFTAMFSSAFMLKAPPADWEKTMLAQQPKNTGVTFSDRVRGFLRIEKPVPATHNVHISDVMRTRQFFLMWTTFTALATSGMAIASTAKLLVSDVFGGALPHIVTPAFATGYVSLFALFNLGGRLVWASTSDIIGQRRTMFILSLSSIPMFASIPLCTSMVTSAAPIVPLVAFTGTSLLIVSMFGGACSTIPAYEANVFGTKYLTAIHSRMLTGSGVAGTCGPLLISKLRRISESKAIGDLAAKCDPIRFKEKFGAPIDQLQSLADAKTVTIQKLMEIVPAGTIDPTPYLYDSTMYAMSGLACVAALTNFAIRPVPKELHMLGDKRPHEVVDGKIESIRQDHITTK